jgi:hypothetical protein
MVKRVVAGALWAYAACYGANVAVSFLGLSDVIVPLAGVVIGLFVAMDPLHRIWDPGADRRPAASGLVADQV